MAHTFILEIAIDLLNIVQIWESEIIQSKWLLAQVVSDN